MNKKASVAISVIIAIVATTIFALLPESVFSVNSFADGTVSGNSPEAAQMAAEQSTAKFVTDIATAQNQAIQTATLCYAIASANGTQAVFPQKPETVAAGALATYPTAIVKTDTFSCFNKSMLDQIKKNPLLNYEIHYKYQDKKYVLVIPAGADFTLVAPINGFYGFKYLELFFGGYQEF